MKHKLIITEAQHKVIEQYLLENNFFESIVEKLKGELDYNYEPMIGVVRKGGEYTEQPMIKIKVDGETITPKALFDYLSYKYTYNPAFLKQVITDWVFGRIKDNRLTKNVAIN
jgi:hypothetical protein